VNTDPAAIRVLCFGDSNTHGTRPDDYEKGRLPADDRWTGRLQELLGERYDVIEEGLNGRTTDVDYPDRPGCNGRDYLLPCLMTHFPLDVVVVMLGSNDLKAEFGRSARDIAAALGGLLKEIATYTDAATTVLVSPIRLDDRQPRFRELMASSFDARSVAESRELARAIRPVAEAHGVLFADAAAVASAGPDGLHHSLDSHQRLATLLAGVIREST
jgi:lysophospholipase L1-like esterase